MKTYKKRTELNPKNHPYTGNIMCLYTRAPRFYKTKKEMIISISDCHSTIRFHRDGKGKKATREFYKKVKKLRKAIQDYENFLKRNQ